MHPQQDLYINESFHIPAQLLEMRAVRSSGPGGQHVNKVSSKVELFFDVKNSACLNEEQKLLLFTKLKNKISIC